MHVQTNAILRSTGESIVREHRDEMLRRAKMREFNSRGEVKIKSREENSSPSSLPAAPSRQALHLLPPRPFSFLKAINWTTALNYACWGVIVAALFYLGVVILAPFTVKHLLR